MVTVNIRRDSPTAQGSPHGVDAERIRLREQGDGVLAESLLPPFAALADLPRDEKPVWSSGLMVEWHTDRKSTRLNSSHRTISYAVFCLKKKKRMISMRGVHDGKVTLGSGGGFMDVV